MNLKDIGIIFLVFTLLISEFAWSKESVNDKEIQQQIKSTENPNVTIKFDTSSLEKTIKESIKEASEKPDSKEKLESEDKLVLYNLLLVIGTFLLASLALWQGFLFRRSVSSEQRPWVVVEKIIPASDLDLKSGLSFTFIVKNVGKSPGMNVEVSAVMHLAHRGDVHKIQKELRSDHANTRRKLSSMKDISFGKLLIPGGDLSITTRAANEPIEYEKAAALTPTGEIIIFIVGQVSYRFDANNSWHESGFIFSVSRRGGQWVTLSNEITPARHVEITAFSAGFYAT